MLAEDMAGLALHVDGDQLVLQVGEPVAHPLGAGTLHTSAATVIATSTAALPVPVRKNTRSGV